MPYLLGGLLGGGVLLAWYGLGRVRDREAPRARQRLGLLMVNAGIILVAISLYLFTKTK
jgi:hypothetical protein